MPAGAISSVVIVIAMQAEAVPLAESLQLVQDDGSLWRENHKIDMLLATGGGHLMGQLDIYCFNKVSLGSEGCFRGQFRFPKGVPWIRYHGIYEGINVSIVVPGRCPIFGVDNVGTVPAALVAYASIQALQPDLVINAGTAGGFKAKDASVGDVFIVADVAFHDRRIPIPIFDEYGIGAMTTTSTPNLVKTLGLKVGKLSTGNSLDMTPQDEVLIKTNDASVKDMEGAAVVYVANLLSVPVVLLKAVTDIVDGMRPTSEEFLENLSVAAHALLHASTRVLNFVKGKHISDL